MKKQPLTLTPEESAFAAEHHSLIYRYLSSKDLSEDEYYDVVVFGYLRGVQKHFRRKDLQQYAFTTLAWRAMNSCYNNHVKSLLRPKNGAQVLSLDECRLGAFKLEETIADTNDFLDETIQEMALEETLKRFEETEQNILRLLMAGYSENEICKRLNLNPNELGDCVFNIQCKALPLLLAA